MYKNKCLGFICFIVLASQWSCQGCFCDSCKCSICGACDSLYDRRERKEKSRFMSEIKALQANNKLTFVQKMDEFKKIIEKYRNNRNKYPVSYIACCILKDEGKCCSCKILSCGGDYIGWLESFLEKQGHDVAALALFNYALLEQFLDQVFVIGCMLRLLAYAESYAYSTLDLNESYKKYKFYDWSEKKESKCDYIKYELINFLQKIKMFEDNYGKYEFPTNLSKEKAINDVNEWNRKVKENNEYYRYIIKLLGGKLDEDEYKEILKESGKIPKKVKEDASNGQSKVSTLPRLVYNAELDNKFEIKVDNLLNEN